MKKCMYSAIVIFSSALALPACQTAPQSIMVSQQTNTVATPVLDSDGDGIHDNIDRCPNTPKNVVTDDYGCEVAISMDRGLKIEYRAFFDKNSSNILPKYQAELERVGLKMQEHKTAMIRIEGHSSRTEVDSADLNKPNSLAQARADNIKNYLMSKFNIAPERITTIEYGANRPIAPSNSEEGDMFNRRVYALVLKPEEKENY